MRRNTWWVVALWPAALATGLGDSDSNNDNFTIINGQIFTPGLAIIDSPQPYTPEGGDFLQVAIDISGDGKLPWPPSTQSPNASTLFHNITIFLTSVEATKNFTISNGTVSVSHANGSGSSAYSPYVPPVLSLEPSSTVKHVNWLWPSCLVGNGDGNGNENGDGLNSSDNNARGAYNISIHQSFRWNNTDYYTIFDLPISVSNSINASPRRVSCVSIENQFLGAQTVDSGSPLVNNGSGFTGSGSPAGTSPGSGGEVQPGDSGAASRLEAMSGTLGTVAMVVLTVLGVWTLA